VIALLLAVALDLGLGDPPNRWHPVAWMGQAIGAVRRHSPAGPAWLLVIVGGASVAGIALAAGGAAALLERLVAGWPLVAVIVEAVLLKCAFSLRALTSAVTQVRIALAAGDVAGARHALGFHLVSRPTDGLAADAVASGAVESLAENLTDSWVAPICFYLVGGVPAAWAYRAVNTADAMIGYREGRLEYLGKAAARLDDVLNFLPARLAALALVAAAHTAGESARGAWRVARRDGARTASPNAGWTMAAMAGALDVTLEKQGHYRLGSGSPPDAAAIDRALRVARHAVVLTLGAALLPLAFAIVR
jgi:adenosylcobinamide-phosphate synthase